MAAEAKTKDPKKKGGEAEEDLNAKRLAELELMM